MEGVTTETLQRTIGVRFLGCIFNLILEGAVLVQTWSYFERFGGKKGDPLWTQMLVAVCLLATLGQSIALFEAMYKVHVLEFGNPAYIEILPLGIGVASAFTPIVSAGAQMFFARRCWIILGHPRWFLAVFTVLIAYVFVGGFVVSWAATAAASFQNVRMPLVKGTYSSWLVVCAVVDIAITVILCARLWKVRKQTAYRDTNVMIVSLITRSLETCALTSALVLATVIVYFIWDKESYYVLPYEPVTKVYASSLLVHLSTRSFERGEDGPRFRSEHSLGRAQRELMDSNAAGNLTHTTDYSLKRLEAGMTEETSGSTASQTHAISIHVSRDVETAVERAEPKKDRRPMTKAGSGRSSPPPTV